MKRFLVLLLLFGMIFATLSIESYSVSSDSFTTGENGFVKITLSNTKITGVSGSTSEGISVYGSTVEGVEMDFNTVTVGTLEEGASTIVNFPFRVRSDALGGIKPLKFTIRQAKGNQDLTILVPIIIVNPPELTITTNKQTITGIDNVTIKIVNSGGSINKVKIKMNTTKFSFIGYDQIYLDGIDKTVEFNVQLDARDADEGVNKVPIILTYQEQGGIELSEQRYLLLTVQKEKVDLVFTQNGDVSARKDDQLSFQVRNLGREVKDVKMVIENAEIKTKETKEIRLGDFKANEEKTIQIPVFVDSPPGILNVKMNLKWIEDNLDKNGEIIVPVKISSDADVGVFIDAKPTPIAVGGEYTLSALVSNTGSYRIENVEIALFSNQEEIELLSAQNTQYIGRLENDDSSTVQYKVRVKASKAGTYPLNFEIKYKDQSGIWINKNVTKTIMIRSAEEGQQKTGGNSLIYIVALVVIVVIAYWWHKKKSKQRSV